MHPGTFDDSTTTSLLAVVCGNGKRMPLHAVLLRPQHEATSAQSIHACHSKTSATACLFQKACPMVLPSGPATPQGTTALGTDNERRHRARRTPNCRALRCLLRATPEDGTGEGLDTGKSGQAPSLVDSTPPGGDGGDNRPEAKTTEGFGGWFNEYRDDIITIAVAVAASYAIRMCATLMQPFQHCTTLPSASGLVQRIAMNSPFVDVCFACMRSVLLLAAAGTWDTRKSV